MDDETPNVGKELASFVLENIGALIEIGRKSYRTSEAKFRSRISQTYNEYAVRFWETYSRGRSFFVRDETDIYDFYVSLPIARGAPKQGGRRKQGARIVDPSIKDVFGRRNASIVTGTGGSGKSMLVRHLVLDALVTGFGVPIFIELRNLTGLVFPPDFKEFIFDHLRDIHLDLSNELLEESLKLGHFVIIIDGFDELPESQQEIGSEEIQRLAKRYPKSRLLVTSRPDDTFTSWHGFDHFTMAPLTKQEAIDFVERQQFDRELSLSFQKELDSGSFEKHQSFLSNPLLLTIMMLTFGQSASIPDKLAEFYSNAFEALYQRHDVLKGGYTRPRHCSLDFSDYSRAFSAFCLHSYSDRCVIFTEESLSKYARLAKVSTQLEFSTADFIKDSIKAVCLLVDEGLRKTFAHRSFQEYFAAKFIANCPDRIAVKLLEVAEPRIGYDRVHMLAHELNPGMFESQYLGPRLLQIRDAIGVRSRVGIQAFTRFLKRNYDSIKIDNKDLTWSCSLSSGKDFVDHRILSLTYRIGLTRFVPVADETNLRISSGSKAKFSTRDLSYRSPVVRVLYESGATISGSGLDSMFSLGEDLIAKGAAREQSLTDVLANLSKGLL